MSGVVELPRHLFWSALDHKFNLDARYDALAAYQNVLNNARADEDLSRYLNLALLRDLWGDLILPARIRQAWEAAHPELATRASISAA